MELAHADAVVIGAGAGFLTAAVFFYSGERFQNYFRDLAKKYKFHDISKILEKIELKQSPTKPSSKDFS